MKTLLLIDSNGLIHRFFHALPPLTTPKGEPSGAIYGLSAVLLKIFREQKPDFAAATFDRPEMTFREQEYKEYKIHRPPTASELVFQLKEAHATFPKFGIKFFETPGFEADDIIGALVERFKGEPDLKIVILSGDLDTLQLVDDEKIVVQFLKKGVSDTVIYDEKTILERYGLKPVNLTDYKGLVGDPSDNIPGIKGVGEKTALPLLTEFKTIEEIFENISIIPEKVSKKLEGQKEQALFSKKLATIRRDAPLELKSLEELKISPLDKKILTEYFQNFGFKSLIERLTNNK